MLAPLLISYYLHQVTLPSYRSPATQQELATSSEGNGSLTVSALSPEAGSVAPGSQRIEMLRITLQAACDADVTLESITLYRAGLGAKEDILSVYAMSELRRVSDARSFSNQENSLELRFRNFIIPACGQKTLSILADFSPDASPAGEHRIELRQSSDIVSSAKEVRIGKAPAGALQRTVGQNVGLISFESLSLLQNPRYGRQRIVARFRLSADSSFDHRLSAITFTNQGSARNDNLQQLFLVTGGKAVTKIVPKLDSDRVRLVFDPPLILERSQTRLFELKSDVRMGRSKTIGLTLEEPGDLEAEPIRGRK